MIRFAIDKAGFNDRLICGSLNFFEGWIADTDETKEIQKILFSVGERPLAELTIRRERPDLLSLFNRTRLGFWGVIDIPDDSLGKLLRVEAILADGTCFKMKEYLLTESIPSNEVKYREDHNLPGQLMQYQVVGNIDPEEFMRGGKSGAELIKSALMKNGSNIENLRAALDFGVGCGRIFRWWRNYAPNVQFYGTDINPDLISWCKENLAFGKYSINGLHPPTEYDDAQFDLIYAFSVFTHLTEEIQREWLREFRRILVPRGHLLLSVHGDQYVKDLPPESITSFKRTGYLVVNQEAAGDNLCATYQSREFCQKLFLTSSFEICDYIAGGVTACGRQDLFVLRKLP